MNNLSRCLQLACHVLVLSFLSSGKMLAELPASGLFSQETTYQLIAQDTSSSENLEQIISPPLTQDQKNKVAAIDKKYIPQLEAAAQNYNRSVEEINALIGANPSNNEIIDKRNTVVSNEMKFRDLAFNRLIEIREVLTPEQQASLAASIRKLFDSTGR